MSGSAACAPSKSRIPERRSVPLLLLASTFLAWKSLWQSTGWAHACSKMLMRADVGRNPPRERGIATPLDEFLELAFESMGHVGIVG